MSNFKIAIVQKFVAHYRVDFYNQLSELLSNNNIELTIYAGTAPGNESFKDGLNFVVGGIRVVNHYLWKSNIYWQWI